MKKKRNTLYKPAVKTRVADALIIFLCLSGLFFIGIFFYRDLISLADKEAAIPIGSVTRKNNVVLRQRLDRPVWTRLTPESPVYSGDAIRTGWLSDAVITFANGDSIELLENCVARIAMDADSRTRIALSDGSISARAKETELVVAYKGQIAVISGGGALQAVCDENGALILRVAEGKAILFSDGKTRLIAAGATVSAGGSVASTAASPENPSVVVHSPPLNHEVAAADFPVPVPFSWTTARFSMEYHVRLDIALDRRFSRIVRTIDSSLSSVSVDLDEGMYWWRIYPAKDDSGSPPISSSAADVSTGTLRIRRDPLKK
ncbi:MAG: hypothetical protein LBL45_11045 [Treponema sp.]|jgi:predicted RecA/RadA family phage recombinase|nr:hypothetical protein [Treponema sp.]